MRVVRGVSRAVPVIAAGLVVLVASVAVASFARPYALGLSFVVRVADLHGVPRRLADLDASRATTREISISGGAEGVGAIRARVYAPEGGGHQTALLVSGLHPSGIDEPRLVGLARQLAASGVTVVTPDIPELSSFAITPATTDAIERSAVWLSSDRSFTPKGRIGMMGISFSGGLVIVAAGRPSLRDHVSFLFALGGHDDLPRVLRYLCTGLEPGAGYRAPHDYGVAVILLGVVDRLVPAAQVAPLKAAVRQFLRASALNAVDQPEALREFEALRRLAATMPEPSRTLLTEVNNRDVARLGPLLLPYIDLYGDPPALSVSRSPKPTAPVFLLHGADDNIVPADESRFLADDLRGHAPVRLLVSELISHADLDRSPRVREVFDLARFWGDLLRN